MAVIVAAKTVKGTVQAEQPVSGKLTTDDVLRGVVSSGTGRECKSYTGSYDVTPMVEEQTLETYDRHMEENVTIRAIPYHEVTNNSGGLTATIGDTTPGTGALRKNLFNADNIKDGFVSNAAVGSAFVIGANDSFPDAQYCEVVLPEGVRQISFDFSEALNPNESQPLALRIRYSDDNGKCVSQTPWTGNLSETLTLQNNPTKLYIVALSGFNKNIKTSGMLNIGSTLLPWEPYLTY